MSDVSVWIANRNATEATLHLVRTVREHAEEILVLESSDPPEFARLRDRLTDPRVRILRLLPLGTPDLYRPYACGLARSETLVQIDTDERPLPGLLLRWEEPGAEDAWVVPRWEEQLRATTRHLRWYRRRAVRFEGPSYGFPRIEGTVGHLAPSEGLTHGADYARYFDTPHRRDSRAYFLLEASERPIDARYLERQLGWPPRGRPPGSTTAGRAWMSAPGVRLALELERLRNLVTLRSWRYATFQLRYGLQRDLWRRSLAEEERAMWNRVAAGVARAGNLYRYLGVDSAEYLERLTASYAWDRAPGLVLGALLVHREVTGRIAETVPSEADVARMMPSARAGS